MAPEPKATPPSVMWAQNHSYIYLTFNVECRDPIIKIEKDHVSFKGKCEPEKQEHEVNITLYSFIKVDLSKYINKGRKIEVLLAKENENAVFWPSLTMEKKKYHWLKVDFNRWIDEDDSSDEKDFCDMFDDKLGAIDDDDSESDEEEDLPKPELEVPGPECNIPKPKIDSVDNNLTGVLKID